MKILRYLVAIALVFGLTSVAKAGISGFQMVVVDPTVPIDLIQPVYSDDFALDFPTSGPAEGCKTSQGVDPSDYSACFTGINLTGKALTSLEIELPVDTGFSPVCSNSSVFDVTCGTINDNQDYLFDFTFLQAIPTATIFNSFCYFDPFASGGGACSSPAIFTIAIGATGSNGLSVNLISTGYVTTVDDAGVVAQADVTPTPEPSSLLLMFTGVFSIGLFGAFRRRQIFAATRPPNSAKLS